MEVKDPLASEHPVSRRGAAVAEPRSLSRGVQSEVR